MQEQDQQQQSTVRRRAGGGFVRTDPSSSGAARNVGTSMPAKAVITPESNRKGIESTRKDIQMH